MGGERYFYAVVDVKPLWVVVVLFGPKRGSGHKRESLFEVIEAKLTIEFFITSLPALEGIEGLLELLMVKASNRHIV